MAIAIEGLAIGLMVFGAFMFGICVGRRQQRLTYSELYWRERNVAGMEKLWGIRGYDRERRDGH